MNIVVGYIRSPEGSAALDRAVSETLLRKGRLTIVHSMQGGNKDSASEVIAYREDLEAISEDLRSRGVDHEVMSLARGNSPAEDLLEVADDMNADLIVIGLRRRSPVGKLLLGSNAEEVLLRADGPVLAVKPQDT